MVKTDGSIKQKGGERRLKLQNNKLGLLVILPNSFHHSI